MPNPIKEFFEKKKAQAKFKVAGPGQKLGDAASAERDSDRDQLTHISRKFWRENSNMLLSSNTNRVFLAASSHFFATVKLHISLCSMEVEIYQCC